MKKNKNFSTLREAFNIAKSKTPRKKWNWMNCGTEREWTLNENLNSFKKYKINQRILNNVSKINTNVKFLGVKLKIPLMISPMGYVTQYHKDGELEMAKGADMQKTFFTLSPVAGVRLEEISKKIKKPNIIYQFYSLNPKNWVEKELKKISKLGVKAICVGADVPVRSIKYQIREDRYDARKNVRISYPRPPLEKMSSLNWNDITWLKKATKLPIIVKGIMNVNDAKKCFRLGAHAIWVSNHGGRSLESGLASLDILPSIRKAVKNKTIIFDGGARTGTDIFKALCLGANIVSIGRSSLYGLIVNGAKGVKKTFDLFEEEFVSTMGLSGCNDIKKLNSKFIL